MNYIDRQIRKDIRKSAERKSNDSVNVRNLPVKEPLVELYESLYKVILDPTMTEEKLQNSLKKVFGSVEKGRGTILALRNTMRNVMKD